LHYSQRWNILVEFVHIYVNKKVEDFLSLFYVVQVVIGNTINIKHSSFGFPIPIRYCVEIHIELNVNFLKLNPSLKIHSFFNHLRKCPIIIDVC